jgi:hypothetical protein
MKFLVLLFLPMFLFAQVRKEKNINYEYKKYEKFDFDSFQISAEKGSPGDITVSDRLKNKFKNKLPEKPDFKYEARRDAQAIL